MQPADFYPVAVWYGGGKARAPMLERVDSSSAERWGKDLDQIKAVGFNTVKCWVDWATAESKPGEFDFQNLDLLMRLAQERGLRVVVQVYLDSAPDWVGKNTPTAGSWTAAARSSRRKPRLGFVLITLVSVPRS